MMLQFGRVFRESKIKTPLGKVRMLDAKGSKNHTYDLVLVHGLIVSSSFMEPTARCLARKGHRVLVPDLLAHGKSDNPKRPPTVKDHADSLVCVLEKLKVRNPVIVGGSYGCQVAVELSNRVNARALAFVGPTPGGELAKAIGDLATDALYEPPGLIVRVLSEIARIGPRNVITLLEDMNSYPFHERLRTIKAPILVITGEHDPFFHPGFMDETARAINWSQSLCMPKVAHGLPYSEPALISEFIERFLIHLNELENEVPLHSAAA